MASEKKRPPRRASGKISRRVLLSVDGGGSKARALVDEGGRLKGRIEWFGLNPYDIDRVEFEKRLRTLLGPLLSYLKGSRGCPATIDACVALAGAGDPAIARRCRRIISRVLGAFGKPGRLAVTSDAGAIVDTSLVDCGGVVLLAGTGSVCFAVERASGGRSIYQIGGRGGILDEGSAFRMGTALLSHTLRAAGQPSLVDRSVQLLCERQGITLDRIPVRFVPPCRAEIASLARILLDACAEGDRFAKSLVAASVADLIAMVRTGAESAHLGRQFDLFLSGGLFQNEIFRRRFLARLGRDFPRVSVHRIQDAALAALEIARRLSSR